LWWIEEEGEQWTSPWVRTKERFLSVSIEQGGVGLKMWPDWDGELRPGGREAAELAECRPFSRRRSPPSRGYGGGRLLAWVAVGVAGADVTLARVVRRRREREEGQEEGSGQQERSDGAARHPCGSCSHAPAA